MMREKIDFESATYGEKKISTAKIKAIGVGGGGGNAVKHMYEEGIKGVEYLVCNTDKQAIENNPVPHKLILGSTGLGAGANPEVAKMLALETKEKIKESIGEETKMIFITAGMGKGTGTGATPIIAKIAKEMGILTIGIVTFPFKFEGDQRFKFAQEGIEELKKHVDSLIVIKNQNIIKYYKDDIIDTAFAHADDVLKNAVQCIAELITVNADQNVDFNDIEKIMKNSESAMLGLATARGENRIQDAVNEAFNCPLLEQDMIANAKNFLFFISYGQDAPLTVSELDQLTEQFDKYKGHDTDLIWGRSCDKSLGDSIKLSVIVTNYSQNSEKIEKNVYGDEKKDEIFVDKKTGAEGITGLGQMSDTSNNDNNNDLFDKETGSEKDSFLNKPDDELFKKEVTPIKISSFSDYEDNKLFNKIIDTPALLRKDEVSKQIPNVLFKDRETTLKNILDIENDEQLLFKTHPD